MLELVGITKSFEEKVVLQGVTVGVPAGKILVLLGPSGCGKTTLLRIVAGLETADAGQVTWQGTIIDNRPIHQRGFGMVFQDYALFPHKNVYHNIAFGLRMQRQSADDITQRVNGVLQLVGLTGFGERAVHDLSGGEQQRVALARALAPTPDLLLLDEPLGALDRALRERLMLELRAILTQTANLTAIYVTHDQAEAFAIADLIAVMNGGHIEQVASPAELYTRPGTPFVARFLGMENIIPATPTPHAYIVETLLGKLTLSAPLTTPSEILIRPDAGRTKVEGMVNVVPGRVTDISFRGRYKLVTLAVNDVELKLEFEGTASVGSVGDGVSVGLDPAGLQAFPAKK